MKSNSTIKIKGIPLEKVKDLLHIFPSMTSESIVFLAIDRLHQENIMNFGDRLYPNDNGNFDLEVGRTIIAEVEPDALKYLDPTIKEKMLKDGVVGGYSQVIKSAIQNEKGLKIIK
jgi:hypothetical protein